MVAFCGGHLSGRSRVRKLSPPSRLKTSIIVLALLMQPPPQRVGILLLCVWCSRQLGDLKASLERVSPRALASRLRLATCYLVPVLAIFRTAREIGVKYKRIKTPDFCPNSFSVKTYVETYTVDAFQPFISQIPAPAARMGPCFAHVRSAFPHTLSQV